MRRQEIQVLFCEHESGRMGGWGFAITKREGLGSGLCGDSRLEIKR